MRIAPMAHSAAEAFARRSARGRPPLSDGNHRRHSSREGPYRRRCQASTVDLAYGAFRLPRAGRAFDNQIIWQPLLDLIVRSVRPDRLIDEPLLASRKASYLFVGKYRIREQTILQVR